MAFLVVAVLGGTRPGRLGEGLALVRVGGLQGVVGVLRFGQAAAFEAEIYPAAVFPGDGFDGAGAVQLLDHRFVVAGGGGQRIGFRVEAVALAGAVGKDHRVQPALGVGLVEGAAAEGIYDSPKLAVLGALVDRAAAAAVRDGAQLSRRMVSECLGRAVGVPDLRGPVLPVVFESVGQKARALQAGDVAAAVPSQLDALLTGMGDGGEAPWASCSRCWRRPVGRVTVLGRPSR